MKNKRTRKIVEKFDRKVWQKKSQKIKIRIRISILIFFFRHFRICGTCLYILPCQFSCHTWGVTKWSSCILAFTHCHDQFDSLHRSHLFCVWRPKTLRMVHFPKTIFFIKFIDFIISVLFLCGSVPSLVSQSFYGLLESTILYSNSSVSLSKLELFWCPRMFCNIEKG